MSDTHVAGFEHHRVSLLLPWWINGTLEERDQRMVEKHVGSCTICQEEYNLLRICLFDEATEPETTPDAKGQLADVMKRIDLYEDAGKSGGADNFAESTVVNHVSTADSLRWSNAKLTGMLSMVAVVLLLFTTVILMRSTPDSVVSDGQYNVLSSPTPATDDLFLEVRFQDQLAAREGFAQLQKSLDNPNVIMGWKKTDDVTLLFRIAATTSPATLSLLLNRLGESDAVNKAALVVK